MSCHRFTWLIVFLVAGTAWAQTSKETPRGHYRLLPGAPGRGVPFHVLDFTYGRTPADAAPGAVMWQIDARPEDEPSSTPLFQLRAVTSRDPLAESTEPIEFLRYILRIPATAEVLEYRNVHTGKALLPPWGNFAQDLLPRPARATGRQHRLPNTCEYLGHVLTLRSVEPSTDWQTWPDPTILELDPELIIATGRTFKDAEGHRLPQTPERRNYTYVPWTEADYRTMIEAGFNYFGVVPGVESYLRKQPVFYRGGAEGLAFPTDLYRSSFVGPVMFIDEPTCIMQGDKIVNTTLKFFTDAAALITRRVESEHVEALCQLDRALRAKGAPLGNMCLTQPDYASWETRYETAFYQLAGGPAGIVHEGRYQLGEFNEFAKASTGLDRRYSAEEMFRYHFAVLRGAARHFDRHWGISIYGQADPQLSPVGIKLAYDMGARYVWYWTSDHDHHLPWPEQLELTRTLKAHAKQHPRPSIGGPKPLLDKVIVIPFGYFLVLESPTTRKNCWDLWWVRELDAEGKNESSQRYRRLMRNAFVEVNKALDAHEDFDITVDDGREVRGYRRVVHVTTD